MLNLLILAMLYSLYVQVCGILAKHEKLVFHESSFWIRYLVCGATVVVIEPHNFVKTFALPTNSFHIFCFDRSHLLLALTY